MARLPTTTSSLSTTACAPLPGLATTSVASGTARPRSIAAATIAAASGCSEPRSTAAAKLSTSSARRPFNGSTATTCGRPSVIVPVLSSTTASTLCAVSSTSGLLNRMPKCAPRPVPTMMAAGVAKPKLHGQAIINTATKTCNAKLKPSPAHSQPTAATTPKTSTTGTKYPATTSARRAIGALPACAASTKRTICISSASPPTRVARTMSAPAPLRLPPVTASPGALTTGSDSPVSSDSSTVELPSTTSPSAGMRSPGRTRRQSSTLMASAAISRSPSSVTSAALSGLSCSSAPMASSARNRERASR